MISKDGITATEENIEKLKNFPGPKRVKDVRSFIGLITFYKKKAHPWVLELVKRFNQINYKAISTSRMD